MLLGIVCYEHALADADALQSPDGLRLAEMLERRCRLPAQATAEQVDDLIASLVEA